MTKEELEKKLADWLEAKDAAAQWTEIELTLRQELFTSQFPAPKVGSNKVKLGTIHPYNSEMALIGNHKLNYSIDRAAMEASKSLVEPGLMDKVISWSPKVKDTAFRALEGKDAEVFSSFITEKVGSPALELKPAAGMKF